MVYRFNPPLKNEPQGRNQQGRKRGVRPTVAWHKQAPRGAQRTQDPTCIRPSSEGLPQASPAWRPVGGVEFKPDWGWILSRRCGDLAKNACKGSSVKGPASPGEHKPWQVKEKNTLGWCPRGQVPTSAPSENVKGSFPFQAGRREGEARPTGMRTAPWRGGRRTGGRVE